MKRNFDSSRNFCRGRCSLTEFPIYRCAEPDIAVSWDSPPCVVAH
jgi:hypothetical protein